MFFTDIRMPLTGTTCIWGELPTTAGLYWCLCASHRVGNIIITIIRIIFILLILIFHYNNHYITP